jgi:hypothetical protein
VEANDSISGSVRPDLVGYADLIDSFVSGALTGPQFESAYLQTFKNDPVRHGERAFLILDRLFSDVDEYFDDPDLTDQQRKQADDDLRDHAREALAALTNVSD